jgi:hypothetical protein
MRSIPLDFERRLKQRWAARFSGVRQEHRTLKPANATEQPAGVELGSSPATQGSPVRLARTGANLFGPLVA